MRPRTVIPDLDTLAGLFYEEVEALGEFAEVSADEMPPGYRSLLAHDNHMTVTVEEFHGCAVDVRVLDKRITTTHYARKILLTRSGDEQVVQFGIMRVNFAYLAPQVREEIQSERAPLGRILIRNNVLRQVELFSLYRVTPGEELLRLFGLERPAVTYGRTARIKCDGVPAVELLEIVTPLGDE